MPKNNLPKRERQHFVTSIVVFDSNVKKPYVDPLQVCNLPQNKIHTSNYKLLYTFHSFFFPYGKDTCEVQM